MLLSHIHPSKPRQALRHRYAEFQTQGHRQHISRHVREIEAVDVFNMRPGPELLETTERLLPEHGLALEPFGASGAALSVTQSAKAGRVARLKTRPKMSSGFIS